MYNLILQGSILVVGIGYLSGSIMIASMQSKSMGEKLGYAALLTFIAIVIEFALIAALFNQGEFG